MTDSPSSLHQRKIGDSHQALDRSIQRKNEREVGEAKHPILWSVWDPLLPADELENVGKVSHRRSEGESTEINGLGRAWEVVEEDGLVDMEGKRTRLTR